MLTIKSFKSKLIFTSLFFILTTVLLVSWITIYYGKMAGEATITEKLNNSQSIQNEFFKQQAKQLELISLLVASEPAFVTYIAEAINFFEKENSTSYLTSIADLLLERKQQYSYDISIITNGQGKQLARSDQAISVLRDLSSTKLLNQAITSLVPVTGFWYEDNIIYQVAIVPIARGQQLVGFLITGNTVNNNYLNNIAQLSGTEIVLLKENIKILSTSTDVAQTNALVNQLIKLKTKLNDVNINSQNNISINRQNYVYKSSQIENLPENNNAYIISLVSRSQALLPFIKTRMVLIILAVILSFLSVITTLWVIRSFFKDIKILSKKIDSIVDNTNQKYQTVLASTDLKVFSSKLNGLYKITKGKQSLAKHMVEISKKAPKVNNYFWIGDGEDIIKPNQTIGSRFKILRKIGSGGMGMVFQALDTELNEIIALKVLRKDTSQKLKISQLKDEIKFARRINGANIVRIHDFGKIGGHIFISMEYIMGFTISEILKFSTKLRPEAAQYTSMQICLGLIAAHEAGIVHRDLKPENLIVELDATVKLMDFGIASTQAIVSKNQQDEMIEVTVAYTSPEQLQAKGADERSDIYALGVIIMELFSGRRPFEEKDEEQLMINKVANEPVPITEYWERAPVELSNLILKCIKVNPAERFQTVSDVLRELKRIDI